MIRILHSVSNMDRAGIETMLMNYYRHIDRSKIQFDFKNKNVLRSDMAKEILKGYSEMMPEKTKEAFIAFAEYKENLKYKLKILMLPYNKKKTTKRTFEKVKLRVVFNTI